LLGCSSARQYWLEELRKDRDDMLKERGLPMLCDKWDRLDRMMVCRDCRPDGDITRMLVQVLSAFDVEGGVRKCGSTWGLL
jgi:hypothetical protein